MLSPSSTTARQPAQGAPSRGILQRKCACGGTITMGGECEGCRKKRLASEGLLQRKPIDAANGDSLERDADRMADEVASSPPTSATASEQAGTRQVVKPAHAGASSEALPPAVAGVISRPGAPLHSNVAREMSSHMAADFSGVRVHTGARAAESAEQLNARAYTVGSHVVFGGGQFSPGTKEGKRLLAHELAHVVQQGSGAAAPVVQRKGRGPGSCGLLSTAASTVLGGAAHVQIQKRLMGRGYVAELPIPRATKSKGIGSRRCEPDTTSFGYADIAKVSGPTKGIVEIKPFFIASTLGRAEARHYRLKADQSRQRFHKVGACGMKGAGADDAGFMLSAGVGATTTFDLHSGAISGVEDFGPFTFDRSRNLRAKQTGAGAIGYWCVLNKKGKKKKSKKKKGAKKGGKKGSKPVKKKPTKPSKPAKPKAGASASAANFGFGISIFGTSVGAGNVGLGVSVGSNSAAVGTAGIGASWFSDSAAAGAAGVGASANSDGPAALSAGAGVSQDSQGVGVATAGAGSSKGTTSAAAGAVGAGEVEDSNLAGAGVAGHGEVKDRTDAAAGESGSGKVEGDAPSGGTTPKKPVDPADVSGPGADKVPSGEGDEHKDGDGETEGETGGGKAGGASTPSGEGAPGATPPSSGTPGDSQTGPGKSGDGSPGGTTAPTGTPSKGGTSNVPGSATAGAAPAGQLGVMPVFPFGASDADREAIGAAAAQVSKMLSTASDAQKALLLHLAKNSKNGQYLVPESVWIDKLLTATAGFTADELEYLKTLDWTPGKISAQELRARLESALKTRGKTPTTSKPPEDAKSGDKSKAVAGEGTGGSATGSGGAGKTAGEKGDTKKGSASGAKAGTAGKQAPAIDSDTAKPLGVNADKSAAGFFPFKITSGLTAASNPASGTAVTCSLLIQDKGRTFVLNGVSVTFVSRTETVETKGGKKVIRTTMRMYFTTDFRSDKFDFTGRGGPSIPIDYDFGTRKAP